MAWGGRDGGVGGRTIWDGVTFVPPPPTHISSIYLLSPTKPGGILVNHHVERKTGQQYFATNNKLMKANISIKNDKRPVELFINDFHNLRNCAVCKRKALQRRFENSVKLLLSDLRQKQKHNIILSLRERGVVCVYF